MQPSADDRHSPRGFRPVNGSRRGNHLSRAAASVTIQGTVKVYGPSAVPSAPAREKPVMAMFGKILAVLNVLAAIGFLVVAGVDYDKRQNWAYSHYTHQLVVFGLPIVKYDDSWRLRGRSIS